MGYNIEDYGRGDWFFQKTKDRIKRNETIQEIRKKLSKKRLKASFNANRERE